MPAINQNTEKINTSNAIIEAPDVKGGHIETEKEQPKFKQRTVTPKQDIESKLSTGATFQANKLSKKAKKGVKKSRLAMDRDRVFSEGVVFGRIADDPLLHHKGGTLIAETKGMIPTFPVKTRQIAETAGVKPDIPKTLAEYFVLDSRNPVGIKDICFIGTRQELAGFLEKREDIGVFNKISEDDANSEMGNTEKRYPIYAGVFSEYTKDKKLVAYNPRREIILKAIKTSAIPVAGVSVASFSPPIGKEVKLPNLIAKVIKNENRARRAAKTYSKKRLKKFFKKSFSDIFSGVADVSASAFMSKDKYQVFLEEKKQKKMQKIKKRVDNLLGEKNEDHKFMLRISYMPQDGMELVGERELSLHDLGKKLHFTAGDKPAEKELRLLDQELSEDGDSGYGSDLDDIDEEDGYEYMQEDSDYADIVDILSEISKIKKEDTE